MHANFKYYKKDILYGLEKAVFCYVGNRYYPKYKVRTCDVITFY